PYVVSPCSSTSLRVSSLHTSRRHLDLHSFPTRRSSDLAMGNPAFQEYRARLAARQGQAEADRILGVTLWNTILYPNCSFMSQFRDRKSTRLNSSHQIISYAVFCLKKKKK